MSDPQHLTDDLGDATDFERELLLAAQEVRLSAPEKRAIWAGIAGHVLPAASVSSAASGSVAPGASAAKAGMALAPWLKGLIAVAGLAGISAGIYGLKQARPSGRHAPEIASPRVAVAAPVASARSEPDSAAAQGAEPPSVVDMPSAPSAPSANHEPSPVESKSALREESLAVLDIRRTLRAGDASGALRLLEQARQRFPRGALGQEREALSIEALAKSGARTAAARKADAFLRAHPKSPYAADVQSFTSR